MFLKGSGNDYKQHLKEETGNKKKIVIAYTIW